MEKISREHYAIAAANGISRMSVYRRVRDRGWTVEDAIIIPTDHKSSKRKRSKLYGVARGKVRQFSLPKSSEEQWEKLVAQSGLTEMDFVAEMAMKFMNLDY